MITIDRLTKRFDKRAVLDELSLSLAAGDRIALIGSNGAGKTTLFRSLLGLYRHDGEIRFGGTGAQRRDASVLGRIAFVPQLPPPLRMPVGELLAFAERGAGADRARMTDIAEALGIDLAEVARRPFYRLSGGQKQKVLVTIALARPADLLIFDEPAANLDPAARAVFIDQLAGRHDASMLIASHRLEEVAPLVNRVIELDRGRVVLDDAVIDRLREGEFRRAEIVLAEAHPPFARALAEWGFDGDAEGLRFTGPVPAAETFRFLGLLARYGSLIERMALDNDILRRS
ncbi:ATP-binding cassette domain-containing protein [Maritimibacter sp. HL-12]|uniref:ATP-binding cassette domain-containing protein n=1 Tax=Maritimibacter sp. HL-12 TaxID=1162418 RepID=UPI000A0F0BA2|nr:ABC transporter ATP-binding protein [Maritimibacter sp. HL-12]SMH47293.1 ABC-2 type transport system ATP-binding protein [Maritimibacter sp. HL-12]